MRTVKLVAEVMTFPNTVEEFMEQYKVVDTDQIYSNGIEFVPIFRMEQWFEHVADAGTGRHGTWETVYLDHQRMGCRPQAHYCSECHQIVTFRTFFCPNCGADMRGAE